MFSFLLKHFKGSKGRVGNGLDKEDERAGDSKKTSRFLACDVKWLVHGDFYLVYFIIRTHKWDFPTSSYCSSLHSDLLLKLPSISPHPVSEQVAF